MTTQPPQVLTDPLGVVVELIGDLEPTLDRAAIQDAVTGVAGGRAKRRRLAQALLDNQALLRVRCASRRRSAPPAASS